MSCKAAIYTANVTSQTLAAGATIALGSIIRRFGNTSRCCNPIINLSGSGITLNECGYYKVTARVTDAPAAAGTVTVTLLQDGVAIPGAVASNTAAADTNPTSVTAGGIVRVVGCASSTITAVLTSGAGSVTNVSVDVEKL